MSTTARRWGRRPRVWGARTFCALLGLVYLVIGILGLVETGAEAFEGTESVAGLGGTTLLNIIHTAAGALALAAALHSRTTRLFGFIGLVFFLGLSVYSVVALIDDAENEPLGISVPSTVLHFAAVLVCAALIAWTVGVRESAAERQSATST
ncbi:DUF4383 domain-containing protein [Actinokineospora xionganensis]|uniref:DUF4383 domain-containing protein n=1 Tax=Actinokineospora xionganensis TaxID=2684470 RepID=A0ABR7L150_9PSEU|nr:DUF4383 domain-containing protein [Actinokineospora xionganensis]MBC6446223.1 DUF4383 domain-containing protein [Actinokineospora xionganensis]